MSIVIYHNPDCGTSRNVLHFLRQTRSSPIVIEYLRTGWTLPHLLGLFAAAGLTPRTALRESKTPAESLGLLDPSTPDDVLLSSMVAYPILVNRPIVCTPKGVRLCRPSETVFDLLDGPIVGPITKEDGTLAIDAAGNRVY